jgi:hypothetical protein
MEEIKIPKSWSDISVAKYLKLNQIQKQEFDEMSQINLCAAFADLTTDQVEELPIEKTVEIMNSYNKLIETKIEPIEKDSIVIDDITYYIDKNFDGTDTSKIMFIENKIKKAENPEDVFGELLVLYVRRKNDDGDLEKFKFRFVQERKELFMNKISIADANDLLVFFSNGARDFMSGSDQSLA